MNSFYTTTGEHIVKSTNHHDYHDDLEFCLNLENKKNKFIFSFSKIHQSTDILRTPSPDINVLKYFVNNKKKLISDVLDFLNEIKDNQKKISNLLNISYFGIFNNPLKCPDFFYHKLSSLVSSSKYQQLIKPLNEQVEYLVNNIKIIISNLENNKGWSEGTYTFFLSKLSQNNFITLFGQIFIAIYSTNDSQDMYPESRPF